MEPSRGTVGTRRKSDNLKIPWTSARLRPALARTLAHAENFPRVLGVVTGWTHAAPVKPMFAPDVGDDVDDVRARCAIHRR
jgi:hypothetical protein